LRCKVKKLFSADAADDITNENEKSQSAPAAEQTSQRWQRKVIRQSTIVQQRRSIHIAALGQRNLNKQQPKITSHVTTHFHIDIT
jgi:hypothetical protein